MAFVTAGAVKTAIAAAIKTPEANLQSYWDQHAADAVAYARLDVYGALGQRGFSTEDVDSWDALEAVSKSLALWWALNLGGALSAFDPKFVTNLDRREELETVRLQDGAGADVQPANLIPTGTFRSSRGSFPCDERLPRP